jgi:hypothetical protein
LKLEKLRRVIEAMLRSTTSFERAFGQNQCLSANAQLAGLTQKCGRFVQLELLGRPKTKFANWSVDFRQSASKLWSKFEGLTMTFNREELPDPTDYFA